MQRVLPENVILNIQQNSGQIAIGNYLIQLGSIHGGLVHPALMAQKPQIQLRPSAEPGWLLPFPSLFLGRLAETETALQQLQQGQSVGVYGLGGIGKTTLLAYLLHYVPAQIFPDGIIYLSGRHKLKDDLLQDLFERFYDFTPHNNITLKPSYIQIQRALRDKRCLLVLDDITLSRAELKEFQGTLPNCTLLLASAERYGWQRTEGQGLPLVGLPLENGLELLEAELGRALTSEEQLAARVLWAALEGHPGSLRQAAALVREKHHSMLEVAYQCQRTDPQQGLAELLLAALGEPEKAILQYLAALEGALLSTEHLAALTGLPDILPLLEDLRCRGLIQVHDTYYRLPRYLGQRLFRSAGASPRGEGNEGGWSVRQGLELTPQLEHMLSYFILWAEAQQSSPTHLLQDLEPLLQILEWTVKTERWSEVLRLVRAVDTALALTRRWAAWEEVLQAGLQAAQAAHNELAEAWVLHQLGSRALCLGENRLARAFLSQALQLRERLGDNVGAVITRHNLNLLPSPSTPTLPASEERSSLRPLPMAITGLAILLPVLMLAWLGLAVWSAEETPSEGALAPATPAPHNRILSFAPPPCVGFDTLPTRAYNPHESLQEAGVVMTIEPLEAAAPGLAEIELYGDDFAPVQRLRLQNASLRVNTPSFPAGFSLLFSHLQGKLKLEINGVSEDSTNFKSLDDRTIGNVKLSVQLETEFSGRVEFKGKIETFAIGGQELWLDTLCPQ